MNFRNHGWRLSALVLILILAACGDDTAGLGAPGNGDIDQTEVPLNLCRVADDAEASPASVIDLRTLEHGGTQSDLNLDWTEDSRSFRFCPGQRSINLAIRNDSRHTEGRRVWFTVLYYWGHEYVSHHQVGPQGMNVAVGETVPIDFSLDIRPEFASAGDREIRIALIVQTDNPNPNDPVAFFRRIWINIKPANECGQPAMQQPPAEPLVIHSVTCQGYNIKLQTNPRLLDGTPEARVVKGHDILEETRSTYFAQDHWWADYHVAGALTPGQTDAIIAFGSNANDTMYFMLSPREECGGGGRVHLARPYGFPEPPAGGGSSDPGPDEGEVPDDGNGERPDDPVGIIDQPVAPPGEAVGPRAGEPVIGESVVPEEAMFAPLPGDGEGVTRFVLTPCDQVLPGTTVPSEVAEAVGLVRLQPAGTTGVDLVLDTRGLPADIETGDGNPGVYQPWLAAPEGNGEWRFVALESFVSAGSDAENRHIVALEGDAVLSVGGHAGTRITMNGDMAVGEIVTDTEDALPLSAFTHFFVTIEPQGESGEALETPTPRLGLSGAAQ
jgi:hypothetical protein